MGVQHFYKWIYVHLRFNVFQKTVCHLLVSETLRGEFFIAILLSNFFFQLFDTFSLRHQQHHISRRKHCRKKEYLKKQNVPIFGLKYCHNLHYHHVSSCIIIIYVAGYMMIMMITIINVFLDIWSMILEGLKRDVQTVCVW